MPCIPPLFYENKFVFSYKEKTNFFILFLRENVSSLKLMGKLPHESLLKTSDHLSEASFTADDISKVIYSLDPAKTHGHDMISICMLELWDNYIFKPLELIFKSCSENGTISC